jgi:hypothetical protein
VTRHRDDHPDRARRGNAGKSFQEVSKGQFDKPAMAKGSKYSARQMLDALRFVTGSGFQRPEGGKGGAMGYVKFVRGASDDVVAIESGVKPKQLASRSLANG